MLIMYVSPPTIPVVNGWAGGELIRFSEPAGGGMIFMGGMITFAGALKTPAKLDPPATGSEIVPSGASVGRMTIKSADIPCEANWDGLYVLKFLTVSFRYTVVFQVPSSLNFGKAAVKRHVPFVGIPLTNSPEDKSVDTVCAPEGLRKKPANAWLANGVSGAKLTPLRSSVAVIST